MAQRMKERMEDLAEETKRIEEIQQQMEAAMAGSPVTGFYFYLIIIIIIFLHLLSFLSKFE